ncbi:hypothetical protein PENTCL1PPCAC_29273, partial [Pristionchus entomophagus]
SSNRRSIFPFSSFSSPERASMPFTSRTSFLTSSACSPPFEWQELATDLHCYPQPYSHCSSMSIIREYFFRD